MLDFLEHYHLMGMAIGLATFLIIGLFHPLVIKAEYYWGTRSAWVFLGFGISGMVFSLLTDKLPLSILAGVFSFSCFWSILEVFAQKKRVEKGWFPANPKKKRLVRHSQDDISRENIQKRK